MGEAHERNQQVHGAERGGDCDGAAEDVYREVEEERFEGMGQGG